jgi:NADH:ubiquinone oxidoreductase subunit C
MTNDALKTKITELLAGASFEEGGEFVNVNVEAADWKPFAHHLRYDEALQFDFLNFCTCIDWKTHLSMLYYLDSYTYHHNLVVRIKLSAEKPEVETICDIWQTANFHEREVYELFGVNFLNHPDLRLLILEDGWEGRNPLRKDFEDPVNMIKL